MADRRFAVVFSGRIVDGADGTQVRKNLVKLFKSDTAKVETLFSGQRVVIKKDLDESKARHYEAVLAKAGAIVEVVSSNGPAAETPAQTTARPATAVANATKTPPSTPPQAPDLTIAEPGVTLVEYEIVPRAEFDTTQFELAEVGVTLVEPKPVPPAEFDTSGMTLDPPGVQLSEAKPVPPADFDTDSFSLTDDR